MTESKEKSSSGLDQNVAGLLCYLFGFVSGLIFLLIEKENKFVRFHAIQSIGFNILVIVVWIINIILAFIPVLGWILIILLWIGMFILWILLMFKAYKGEKFKLPIIGNFAEKQAK